MDIKNSFFEVVRYFDPVDCPRAVKRLILMIMDSSFCLLALWLSVFARTEEFVRLDGSFIVAGLISIGLLLSIFYATGMYNEILRYSGGNVLFSMCISLGQYWLVYLVVVSVWGLEGVPRSIGFLQPLFLSVLLIATRLFARAVLIQSTQESSQSMLIPKAIIYGAGAAGRQIARVLMVEGQIKISGFVDDSKGLLGHKVDGFKVYAPGELPSLVETFGITLLVLAIPSLDKLRRAEIISSMSGLPVRVKTLPSLSDLAQTRLTISDIQEPEIEEVLGRVAVDPDSDLLAAKTRGKCVLVTGAGGSIGAEICRQLYRNGPRAIILFDSSEFGLYRALNSLEQMDDSIPFGDKPSIVPLLGSVQNERRLRLIFENWQPEIIYHAAAYKHVFLVESNFFEGLENNILGTALLARLAVTYKVDDFVLISSDKAVRPTNVMGATKRVCEMILQAFNEHFASQTIFSIVRFGNVLDSSGSVIPKFRSQILSGGPVTVTHPEVVRFFMTIPEAAQLVIQAGSLAEGGDVFVLQMGEPIKILELAEKMIHLYGLGLKSREKNFGDIEVKITGLKPGEKLYEELLISADMRSTKHPKIMKANEPFIPWDQLDGIIGNLFDAVEAANLQRTMEILNVLVPDFTPSLDVKDDALNRVEV